MSVFSEIGLAEAKIKIKSSDLIYRRPVKCICIVCVASFCLMAEVLVTIMLNLKHLYYFYVFGQELSITKAAKRLHLTPPALSNQLKELENYVGYKLYTREKGKTNLTDKGKIVCKYSIKIFSPYEELRSMVHNQWHV